ncbi:hypothetical protein HPC62_02100 [Thermoleptolyngbya sichuanensis A183]|uniref:Uncharacterized protein n=1 Tax=Thermoleptolyngbya sichuanensis A183 TaxID=2737172 RepID=A0A6M8BAP7_9CYAN|nr:hypothetical protein [Thermoleptolyngbya sichuanensis]QKD81126.1 hypothetical protein HPC62_02100 [Thermoleptolyngbya sichuanensis A183]
MGAVDWAMGLGGAALGRALGRALGAGELAIGPEAQPNRVKALSRAIAPLVTV